MVKLPDKVEAYQEMARALRAGEITNRLQAMQKHALGLLAEETDEEKRHALTLYLGAIEVELAASRHREEFWARYKGLSGG